MPRPPRCRDAVVAALLALIAVLAATTGLASAHAILQASSPADGAHLDAAPSVVSMTFNEPVSASLGSVRVFDGKGNRVDQGDVVARDATVTVGLKPGLGDGGYVVTWRVISADSHTVRGAFTFTVGSGTAVSSGEVSSLFNSGEDRVWDIAGDVARGIGYGGTLLAAGGALFLALVHDGGPDRRALARVVLGAAIAGAIGVVAVLPISAALATGLGLTAIRESGVLGQVLADGVGAQTVLAVLGLTIATVAVMRRRETRATNIAAIVGGLVALLAFAFAGHASSTTPRWLVWPADAIHLVAAGSWFGGLVLLTIFLTGRRRRGEDAPAAGIVVGRFSAMAGWAILVVSGAGLVLAYAEVRAWHALTSTTYGRLLLLKIGIFALVGLVAAYNRYRLVPAVRRAEERGRDAWGYLVRTLRFEVLGVAAIIAITAVLVNTVPARTAAGVGTIYSETKPLASDTVNLVVDPNRVGTNSIHLYLLDQTGHTVEVPGGVTLQLSLPASDIGPLSRTPFVAGPGHYQLDTADLSVAGTWTIVVRAVVSKFDEETASFDVKVNP